MQDQAEKQIRAGGEKIAQVAHQASIDRVAAAEEMRNAGSRLGNVPGASETQKQVAARRLQICMTCEAWRNVPIDHCSKCGCATKAKVFTPKGKEACTMGKWTI
jgi:hypothetical protein